MLATLGISHVATTYSWLPDKIDLFNGMALGAGLGGTIGGTAALLLGVRRGEWLDRLPAIGTLIGLFIGVLAVVAGKVGLDLTEVVGDGPSLAFIVVLIASALKFLPEAATGWSRGQNNANRPSDRPTGSADVAERS